jgi:hypothetical protein
MNWQILHFYTKFNITTFFVCMTFITLAQEMQMNATSFQEKPILFKEGIYLTFHELQNNAPSITDFNVLRTGRFGANTSLEYLCYDSVKNQQAVCVVRNCWGYVKNNTVFISQGQEGMFFRTQIVGALIHYFALETRYEPMMYDYRHGGYYPGVRGSSRRTESREYVIVFQTGEQFLFTYRNFAAFLKQHDNDLYEEMQNIRNKRKMIYHFLLRYNEKHPLNL